MGTRSCHSNQSSYPNGIKNTTHVEANVLSMYAKFRLHPIIYIVSEKKILKHFYENRPFLPPQQPIKFTDLDKSHMKFRGLLNKHFCKKKFQISPIRQKKLSISSFPILSLWELKVAIATRVLIRLEQKHNYSFPLPIDAIYEI